MHCSQATLEQGLRDSLYVDYRKKGSYFECTTVETVKEICHKVNNLLLFIFLIIINKFFVFFCIERTQYFGCIDSIAGTIASTSNISDRVVDQVQKYETNQRGERLALSK